jgi:anti-anti-sigma regulatory factor
MPMIAVWLMDGERLVQALEESRQRLDNAEGEVVLDFAGVRRLDAAALRAMEQLAAGAEDKQVKIKLRGVSAEVYGVLKLARLAPRFFFLN